MVYNRPYKKGRVIFGELIPFGITWRTGANEATTFETNKTLLIGDKILPSGKYSLWTVPNPALWTVVFNAEIPSWGISAIDGKAKRNLATDIVLIDVPVVVLKNEVEQFTISVDKLADENSLELKLEWDKAQIVVPMRVSE